MTSPLTERELAEIRERDKAYGPLYESDKRLYHAHIDRRALLAHIDALSAKPAPTGELALTVERVKELLWEHQGRKTDQKLAPYSSMLIGEFFALCDAWLAANQPRGHDRLPLQRYAFTSDGRIETSQVGNWIRYDDHCELLAQATPPPARQELPLPFDPVVLSMLRSAADEVPPVHRGAVLRAYAFIEALNNRGER